jgi:hypothetical protein
VNQDTLEELGFGLDLMYLALGLESHDFPKERSVPPEVEELEATLRAVLSRANAE